MPKRFSLVILCSLFPASLSGQVPKSAASTQPAAQRTPSARLDRYTGEYNYGLAVVPPWRDAGVLIVNLPEHLEYDSVGNGILRHNDKIKRGPWRISADGRFARLDAESPTVPGVRLQGTARVAAPGRIELVMKITNDSKMALPAIEGLYCFQYGQLNGFPPPGNDLTHVFAVVGGKLRSLRDVPTRNPASAQKGGTVIGCTQDDNWFVAKNGGHIEQGVDAALTALTSLDGKRTVAVAWKPGKSILSNGFIPCIHGDPYYGTLVPGQSAEARGILVFSDSSLPITVRRLRAEGWGEYQSKEAGSR